MRIQLPGFNRRLSPNFTSCFRAKDSTVVQLSSAIPHRPDRPTPASNQPSPALNQPSPALHHPPLALHHPYLPASKNRSLRADERKETRGEENGQEKKKEKKRISGKKKKESWEKPKKKKQEWRNIGCPKKVTPLKWKKKCTEKGRWPSRELKIWYMINSVMVFILTKEYFSYFDLCS